MKTPLAPHPPVAGSSIHHKAASYSVIALLAAIILNIIIIPAMKGVDPSTPRMISLLIGIFMVSAIPAGIIALFGIPKFGKKGLLWKGLIGTLVPLLFVAMAVPAYYQVRGASLRIQMAQVVAETNQNTPKPVDGATRLDRMLVTGREEITAYFTITTYRSSDIDMTKWNRDIVPAIKEGMKKSTLGMLLKKGASVKYKYSGSDGTPFAEIVFDPKDYK